MRAAGDFNYCCISARGEKNISARGDILSPPVEICHLRPALQGRIKFAQIAYLSPCNRLK